MSSSPLTTNSTYSLHLNQSSSTFNKTQPNSKITNVFQTTINNTSTLYPPTDRKIKRDDWEHKYYTFQKSNISNFPHNFDKPNLSYINSVNISINKQITSAHSTNEICEICEKSIENLNSINIATAFHRIAISYKRLPVSQKEEIKKNPTFKILSEKAICQIQSFEPRTLADTAWAFATLGIRNIELLKTLANESIYKIKNFNAQDLSNIAWAFATLDIRDIKLFQEIAEQSIPKIKEFEPKHLSLMSWSFTTLDIRNNDSIELLKIIANDSISKIKDFNAQDLALMSWSFATLDIKDYKLFEKIADESLYKIKDFKPKELSNLAWAFATLNIRDYKLFEKIAEQSISKINDFKSQELATLSWAFAFLNIKDLDIRDLGIHDNFFKTITNKFNLKITENEFNEQNLCNMAWALIILNLKSESLSQKIIDEVQKNQLSRLSKLGKQQLNLFYLYTAKNNLKITWPQNLIDELKKNSFHAPITITSALQKDIFLIFKSFINDLKEEYYIEEMPMPVDIAIVEKKIAIEINGPYHYAYNSRFILGPSVLKQNLLKSLGWTVYDIPYWQWDNLKTVEEKKQYLKDKFDFLKSIEKSSSLENLST